MSTHAATILRRYHDELVDVRLSPHTVRAYMTALERYAEHLRRRGRTLASATYDDVVAHRRRLAAELAPASVRQHLSAIRQLHAWMLATGIVERDVARAVRSPRRGDDEHRPTRLSLEQVARIEHAAHACDLDRLLVCLLYRCALRCEEAVTLPRRSVRFGPDGCVLELVGKGRKRRALVVDAATDAAIASWIGAGRAGDQYLIPSRTARSGRAHLHPQTVARRLQRLARAAGVDEHVHPHALRHARAEHLRASGMDVVHVGAILGHSSVSMTAHYMDPPTSLAG